MTGGPGGPMGWDVIVVGAGAAGLVAATESASRGRRTLLIERNRRAGVKILMSGGTRCNLTQATDKWGIVRAFGEQGNFLHSALASLSPGDLVKMVEDEGVPTKVEETGKIFPVSNRATDVLAALLRRLERSGAELALEESVTSIEHNGDGARSVFNVTTNRRLSQADKLIITVGGQSYPGSGTTGDGFRWAAALGHTVVPPRPALVPLTTEADWVRALSGITIPDVTVQLWPDFAIDIRAVGKRKSKSLDQRRGSLLFTHFGLSGPVVLDISRSYTAMPPGTTAALVCDFLPDLSGERLEGELRQAAAADGKRHVAGILAERLPRRLIEAIFQEVGLRLELRGAELSKAARGQIVHAIKAKSIPITGTRGFAKAEVTAGGVALQEVDSRTMESKLVPGLYFAGEVLDLDGPIGGYNFQAAFSTGVLAGRNV